jgi:hypothetical protein
VPHFMCGLGARWCARADAIFDVVGMHVLDVEVAELQRLVLTVESGQLEAACPGCGVGHWAWPSGPRAARCAVLRPGHLGPVARAGLAMSRTRVPGRNVQ